MFKRALNWSSCVEATAGHDLCQAGILLQMMSLMKLFVSFRVCQHHWQYITFDLRFSCTGKTASGLFSILRSHNFRDIKSLAMMKLPSRLNRMSEMLLIISEKKLLWLCNHSAVRHWMAAV